MTPQPERVRIRIRGTVQGVGFRPFVYGLAARHDMAGFVLNDSHGVLAEVEGTAINAFIATLHEAPPPLARIDAMDITPLTLTRERGFVIRETAASASGETLPAPDAVTCAACLADLFDPASRFYHYPFTTCTDCGPRVSMTGRMPYDRANTSMAAFPPCPACRAEYADPQSRRFHAEAIACPDCGPRLSHTIETIAAALLDGQIVALKGLGGFHLLCDATNDHAVQTLRRRKSRPHKPLAVMVATPHAVDAFGLPTAAGRVLLLHRAGPIVMMQSRGRLSDAVAPGLGQIGLMLPSAPAHHLIFDAMQAQAAGRAPFALVATSANRPNEPLVIDHQAAVQTLDAIADMIVTHDRAVVMRTDDSVLSVIDAKAFFIRRARGFVPDPIDLGQDGPSVLGVGGHLKATLCVTRGREAFVSQHVGDLGSAATLRFYRETAERLLSMLQTEPVLTVCDLHPDYASTRFAEATNTPLLRVQHHAAHLAAIAAEHQLPSPVLGLSLDGHGLGDDGSAWGGELIELHGAQWRRLGHLRPMPMPGGERAAREPWRMGVASLFLLGRGGEAAARFPGMGAAGQLASILGGAGHGPHTTSMGRLFDAAAALLGVCTHQTYEGQAAMELEALVTEPSNLPGGYVIRANVLDFTPLLRALLTPGRGKQDGANLFHGTLIAGLDAWVAQNAAAANHKAIALGGGCFMNRVLSEGLITALRTRDLAPYLPCALPANDGGLSFGQAVIGRAHLNARHHYTLGQSACV
jgi:hydrogenase maturation protein HypF